MKLTDTHTHLYCEEFDPDRDDALRRAAEASVTTLLLPAIDPQSYDRLEAMMQQRKEVATRSGVRLFAMMGLHPTSVDAAWESSLAEAQRRLFANPDGYVAVGEIGLDYYWDRTYEKEQLEVLRRQMAWARELDKPVALHVRKAYEEVLGLLKETPHNGCRGVMHCFGGSVNQALRAIDSGMYIGIGGVVTFKNAGLAEVVRAVPLERIVLETDSPYLAPVPYRGHRNESAYVVEVARKVAEIKELNMEKVAETTSANAAQLFGL